MKANVKRWMERAGIWVLVLIVILAAGLPALARDGAAMCSQAAQRAAVETGVPLAVLEAIALTETGRNEAGVLRPWPWTVNMAGEGLWFDSRDGALAYALAEYQRGARSFDLGCFQINYKWHGQAFQSLDHMLEPLANARYAAQFLRDLYHEKGDWTAAAGAYHSRTPEHADRYAARFDRFLAQIRQAGDAPPRLALADPQHRGPRVNNFPLLDAARPAPGLLGSLVPIDGGPGARLIAVE